MRKRRISYLGALGLALALAIPGTAAAGGTQNGESGFLPQANSTIPLPPPPVQLDDNKFSKNGTFRTHLYQTGISPVVPSTATIDIHADEDIKFNTKGLAQCNPEDIRNVGEDVALQTCRDALIGRGSAQAAFAASATPLTPGTVLLFNGTKQNGNPTVLFDSLAPVPGLVIVSEMKQSQLPGYGTVFSSPVAVSAGGPVPDGTPIIDTDFTLSKKYKDKKLIKKAKKAKKKGNTKKAKKLRKKAKKSWAQARCTDGELNQTVRWTHVSDPPQEDVRSQECTG
jgi:hypothetical protein